MRVICVDDNDKDLNHALELCRRHPLIDAAAGFTDARDALAWFDMNHADLVLLDVNMPDMNGLDLAAELRKKYSTLAIIFVTKCKRYALDAYAVHPLNYLIKPLDAEKLDREINYFLIKRPASEMPRIRVQTFGTFSVMVDGNAVRFERSKSKELLALLVDRKGNEISRREAFLEMWEDRDYDKRAQNYFNVIVTSLRETLRAYGISEMLEMNYGLLRVRPELFDCDLYRYLRGDPDAVAEFRGTYLYGYAWAEWSWGY